MDLVKVIADYREVRPRYARLAKLLEHLLQLRVRGEGIHCLITGRTKEIDSFAKKAVRKRYTEPLVQMKDMAAARAIVPTLSDARTVTRLVGGILDVDESAGIAERHRAHELGYLGINIVGTIDDDLLCGEEDLSGLSCEVQVHTRAQNLWSDMAHPFLYKSVVDLPYQVQRELYGLSVFAESFDATLERAMGVIFNLDGYREATMLHDLDAVYYRFTGKEYDRALSMEALSYLKGAYSPQELGRFSTIIREFAERKATRIEDIFREGDSNPLCNPFLFQPESIVVFERLEKNPDGLDDAWVHFLPLGVLEDLTTAWGTEL